LRGKFHMDGKDSEGMENEREKLKNLLKKSVWTGQQRILRKKCVNLFFNYSSIPIERL
jgi:hypothetical protein